MEVGGGPKEPRSPPPDPEFGREDEDRLEELMRLCYEEGIMPSNIDPGEMSVEGREAQFKLKKVKDDIVRAYEDDKIQEGSFEADSFRRGRVKVESPNVLFYVAKSRAIATWMVLKARDEITIGSETYKLEFKPWLSKGQLRDQRRAEDEQTFWVIAVQVPLDSFFYLEAQIGKAIGTVIRTHPTEPDRLKPSLVNIKYDLDPASRQNIKDKIWVLTPEGDELEVKLASSDTPKCRRCRAFFHMEAECRRAGRQQQQQSNQQHLGGFQPAASSQGYQGPMDHQGFSPSQAPLPANSSQGRPSAQHAPSSYVNPMFSPAIHAQVSSMNQAGGQYPFQVSSQYGMPSWAGNTFLPWQMHQGVQQGRATIPSLQLQQTYGMPLGANSVMGAQMTTNAGAKFAPASVGLNTGVGNSGAQGGTGKHGLGSGSRPVLGTGPPNFQRERETSPLLQRPRTSTPGKQRRLNLEGRFVASDLQDGDENSCTSLPQSEKSSDRIKDVGTPGSTSSKRRAPSLARGQMHLVDNKVLPLFCTFARNACWVISWLTADGSPMLVRFAGPGQPMPSALVSLVRSAINDRFVFRIIPELNMPRLIVDNPEGGGKRIKLFVPIMDVRLVVGQLEKFETEGLRLLPLTWFGEARKNELRRIKMPPLPNAECLAAVDGKLLKDKKLLSPFVKSMLTTNWLVPHGQATSQRPPSIQPSLRGPGMNGQN
ncbi:hypothetical protein CBR_g50343 [Chara braunii]|uniref:Uncharacterized protein n=1 Tax=Chara braunii TaxID=69332 RepID=A0A388K5G3_CHABU|nr:hypothetical protein CBR_g50343 [Chara braunii]|eukprot:GBG65302.1 hypothetical protein CBR_g50343 [Chara braunii]